MEFEPPASAPTAPRAGDQSRRPAGLPGFLDELFFMILNG
jgi:hypothetical protein